MYAALALTTGVVTAACGDDDSGSGGSGSTSSSTTTGTGSTTSSSTTTGTGTGGSGGSGEGGGPAACGDTPATLGADVQPILSQSCAVSGCHAGAAASAGLNLEEGNTYGELVGQDSTICAGQKLVVAGDPDASAILSKLHGGADLCGGSAMPLGRPSLAAADIDKIAAWICLGAEDN